MIESKIQWEPIAKWLKRHKSEWTLIDGLDWTRETMISQAWKIRTEKPSAPKPLRRGFDACVHDGELYLKYLGVRQRDSSSDTV